MNQRIETLKKEFIEKQNLLKSTRETLKREFFGIDSCIDQIIEHTKSWLLLNDFQEKPLIVNLWGLTGVGKTSLIKRMVELIQWEKNFLRFDLGNKKGQHSFRESLEDLVEREENDPLVIVLDEFQHTRTLVGPLGDDIPSDENRQIWELLDSGKIAYYQWQHRLESLVRIINKLQSLLHAGVNVEKGKVVQGMELYQAELDYKHFDIDILDEFTPDHKERWFVNPNLYQDIIGFAGKEFSFGLKKDVECYLSKLNGNEIIAFLNEVVKIADKPTVKNFSKSLIFVIGNLDEAYDMSSNFSSDMDADIFYRQSLEITIPDIKQALKNRFRNEQIARLGNNHVIYPSLSSQSYVQIINKELMRIGNRVKDKYGIQMDYDQSLINIIYKEGVFPTQGVRPILSTIQSQFNNLLPGFISYLIEMDLQVTEMVFSVQNRMLKCTYSNQQIEVATLESKLFTPIEDLRVPKRDDLQAIVAVHESGHAILSMLLFNVIPERVCSISTSGDGGFVYAQLPNRFVSKNELVDRVAIMLGGFVAESIVFGSDQVTGGSESDIQKATSFLHEMYKSLGFGDSQVRYSSDLKENDVNHDTLEIERQVEHTIKQAFSLAESILKEELLLFLKMADYLSDHHSMSKEEILKLLEKYKPSLIDKMKVKTNYYRETLKSKIKNLLNVDKKLLSA